MNEINDKVVESLNEEFRLDVQNKIIELLKFDESGTLIFPPGSGKHRIARYLCLNKHFKSKIPQYEIIFIECRGFTHFSVELKKRLLQNPQKVILILNDLELLFDNTDALDFLQSIHRINNVKLFSFSSRFDKFHGDTFQVLANQYDFINENLLYFAPNGFADNLPFISHFANSYNLKLTEVEMENLHNISSGNQTVIYELLRLLRDNKLKINEIEPSHEVILKSEKINSALAEQIDVIQNLLDNSQIVKKEFIETTYNLGITNEIGEYLSPLLNRFITLNRTDEDIRKELTAQEDELFIYFLQRQNQLITREEIGKIIWKEEVTNKYSDWAIDKLLQNLREKLANTSYSISTKRGRGVEMGKSY